MKALSFTIKTEQPLLLTSFAGDANSNVSYSYIPGSVVRGMIIGRYLKQKGERELELSDPAVYQLFFSGEHTRYLNGYPMSYSMSNKSDRTLPIPHSWKREKTDALTTDGICSIYDLSSTDAPTLKSPKALGENFWNNSGGQVDIYRPRRRMSVHTQRDRQKGRATKANGQVFRYEAIAPGETFQTVIICQDDDASSLQDLVKVSPTAWLGGSRSAGYGKVTLSEPTVLDNWQEISGRRTSDENTWQVTLLSHTLLRDSFGQPIADANALKAAIEAALTAAEKPTTLSSASPGQTFLGRTLIGGFNRKWGLPLPQRQALAAGSVITFQGEAPSTEQIKHLEQNGIGERRVEGFGRIAINAWSAPHMQAQIADEQPRRQVQPEASEPATVQAAQTIAKRIFRQRLEQAFIQETGKLQISPNKLSNSQLSRLELAARRGLSQESFDPVIKFLKTDNLTKTARRQFESSQIKSGRRQQPFYDKLNHLVMPKAGQTTVAFAWLKPYNSAHQLDVVLTPTVTCRLEDEAGKKLAKEFTLRLIMSIAKRAKKEAVS
ncbi:MAG: type III-B CRISPR module-associated Cmr3 family protein [Cyanobacteria bacterium J06634_6]